jgi:hypothetical protein
MDLPETHFFLFGMGDRPKMLYRAGQLLDAATGQPIARWPIRSERILPADYRVEMSHRDGGQVVIFEDESGVWVDRGGRVEPVAQSDLTLPRFETFRHAALLRVLHHELLINIVDGLPLPNPFVYRGLAPWRRDAAMMAMALKLTDNCHLIGDWVRSLDEPFDRNNAGHCEPDNLGQTLYLISLASSAAHPLVEPILAAAERFRRGQHIAGLTDGAEHPVYQTKWLKFGLASLKLDDFWQIPDVPDSYSALFWMDYRDQHVPAGGFSPRARERYPYLAWAEAHFHALAPPMDLANPGYPVTWEAHASQADYEAMAWIDRAFVDRRICMPHSWHAAEMFLYLIERD